MTIFQLSAGVIGKRTHLITINLPLINFVNRDKNRFSVLCVPLDHYHF